MGTQQTNDDGAMGLNLGPMNIDGEVGMPLVMTGSDSTRTLDNLTTWGVTLFGPCDSNCYEYRSASGLYRWSSMVHEWFKQENLSCGYGCLKETKTNPPTIPPPDWNPHDGTTPGTSKVPAVIADEQRMADVFAECAKAVAALRGGVEMLDEVANGMKDQPRFRTSHMMEAAADSLETAIARANGGAE